MRETRNLLNLHWLFCLRISAKSWTTFCRDRIAPTCTIRHPVWPIVALQRRVRFSARLAGFCRGRCHQRRARRAELASFSVLVSNLDFRVPEINPGARIDYRERNADSGVGRRIHAPAPSLQLGGALVATTHPPASDVSAHGPDRAEYRPSRTRLYGTSAPRWVGCSGGRIECAMCRPPQMCNLRPTLRVGARITTKSLS